jgi:Fe2+ or Zn2+ uptake regulation protein
LRFEMHAHEVVLHGSCGDCGRAST